jgi:tetratricopeptide (TPR) repeat protein
MSIEGYDGRVGRAIFLLAFGLLVAFAAPGLYLRDSGELTTAAFTLGVAHETGFSLFCLLGKLAALLPVGEVATRLSFCSALFGALTAWLVYRAVRELAGGDGTAELAGLGASALLLSGLTFWKSSTVAEVYASSAAAIALGLWLFALAARGVRGAGLALALLGGLSLGLHAQLRILLGPAGALFALWKLRQGARWPLSAPLAVAVGASVVAYLPLRAARSPAANWSDPRTLAGVIHHLGAWRIRHAFADQILVRDARLLSERLGNFFGLVEGQLGAIFLLVAAGGLLWLWARARVMGVVAALVLVGDALYSAWINPMGMEDLQDGAPTAVALALCAGVGLAAAARRVPKRMQPFVVCALAVMTLIPAALSDGDAKLGLGFEAAGWSRASLVEAPPRALIFATSDDLLAGAFYQQVVAGLRPDVSVLARQQSANVRAELDFQRALLWEPGSDAPPLGVLSPGIPLLRLELSPSALPEALPLGRRAAEILEPARDPFARRLFAGALTGLGRVYLQRGDAAQSRALFESALRVRPNDAVAATDVAVLRARDGDLPGALQLCEEVLARDPSRQVARLNAARYRLALSDLDGAERDFHEYARRAPREAAPQVGLSRVAARRGDRPAAEKYLETGLSLEPRNAEALALKKDYGKMPRSE